PGRGGRLRLRAALRPGGRGGTSGAGARAGVSDRVVQPPAGARPADGLDPLPELADRSADLRDGSLRRSAGPTRPACPDRVPVPGRARPPPAPDAEPVPLSAPGARDRARRVPARGSSGG